MLFIFSALTDSILENCPKLTSLEIEKSHQKLMDHQRDKNPLPLAWIKWIPNFKNIEKLVISCTIAPKYGNFEPFFQNPMIKLKSLQLMATGAFLRDLFLINLFEKIYSRCYPAAVHSQNILVPTPDTHSRKKNMTVVWSAIDPSLARRILKALTKCNKMH